MRILQVLGRSEGGVARHVERLTRFLAANGLDVSVAAPHELRNRFDCEFHPTSIPEGVGFSAHLLAVGSLVRLIRRHRFSVVHGHGLRAGLDSSVAGRLRGVGCVTTLHNIVQPEVVGGWGTTLGPFVERLLLMLADRVYVASNDMAERLDPAHNKKKVELWPVGVEVPTVTRSQEDVRTELEIPPDRRLIASVARLAPQKALHVLLEAVVKLPDAVVVIAGEGPLRKTLLETAAGLGISDRVRWLGHRNDVGDVIAAADVFCLSSTWEARALAAQEAILLGTPVVATSVGGMTELVEDRRSGRLVPPGDASALSTALADVLKDPETASRYAAEALRRLESAPSEKAAVNRLIETYSGVTRA